MKICRPLCYGSLLAFLTGLGGCKDRTEIQVYRVAKEEAPSAPISGDPLESQSAPITWKVPSGWRTVPPSSMRYASFAVSGEDGESADISVSMLPGEGGDDLGNVNRWRSQIGLQDVGAAELDSLIVPLKSQGPNILMVDMTGGKARVLAGWSRVGGRTWFFKMTAPEGLAGQEKPRFESFLESIQFNP